MRNKKTRHHTLTVEPAVSKLNHTEMIEAARSKVADAMSLFTFASDAVSEANMELSAIITEAKEKQEELQRTISAAEQDLYTNNALKIRLDEFNPER